MSEQPHEQMREHHLSRIRGLAMQRDLRGEPTALEVYVRVSAGGAHLPCNECQWSPALVLQSS